MRPATEAAWRFGGGRRRRHRALVADLLLWALLAGLVTSGWAGHRSYPPWLLLGGLAALGGALAVGRRLPLVPLFVVVALCGLDGNYSFGLPPVSYLLGRRMASTWPAAASYSGLAVLGTPLVWSRSGFVPWATMAGALVYAGLFPWLVGRYRRQQRALVAAGWERAEQLEREQRMLTREVRLRERARIAEDMHDSLGHELSLLALRAGALEVRPDLDERTREAAGQLRAGAAAATGQLRDIIELLRDDPADEAAARHPGAAAGSLGEVADLVRRARAAGMPVELHDGRPAEPMPPLVARAVFRVVQESLTNANKHAGGAAVTVRLDADDSGAVLVDVTNTAPPPGAPPAAPVSARGGRGLVGLRERVRLTGGTLRAGARDGGFEVVARLPVRADRPVPAEPPLSSPVPAEPLSAGASQAEPLSAGPVPVEPLLPDAVPAADLRRRVQREARRGLVAATTVLATLAVTLGGAALGYYLYVTSNSVLNPHRYAELRVGQDWATVLPLLPRREMLEPPEPDPLPSPAGADCRYYRSHGDVLQPRLDVYRICAAHGRLVSKDLLPEA
ncbi:histidine kinase [Micromonospora sp. WMMD1102]|uniref:sensor histidine kinase n=1 Tax=Micromonospora sp. WMMD1102 TaxID=3016105 RepID=UPI002415845C|nr:histidine kinase [Micromonospora sp. WMMD1102]MDG4791219.1 histidine kinase [Micromonospora sp. WMMD1102]